MIAENSSPDNTTGDVQSTRAITRPTDGDTAASSMAPEGQSMASEGQSIIEQGPPVVDSPLTLVGDAGNKEELLLKLVNVMEEHIKYRVTEDVNNAVVELSQKIEKDMCAPWYKSTLPLGIGVGLLNSYYRHYLFPLQHGSKTNTGKGSYDLNPKTFFGYSDEGVKTESEISDAVSQVLLGVQHNDTIGKRDSRSRRAKEEAKFLLSQLHWSFALNESLKKDLLQKLETANVNKSMAEKSKMDNCRTTGPGVLLGPTDRQIEDRNNMEVALKTLNDSRSAVVIPRKEKEEDGDAKDLLGEMTTNAMFDSLSHVERRSSYTSSVFNSALEREAKKCSTAARNATDNGDNTEAARLKRRTLMLETLHYPLVTTAQLEKDIGCVPSHFLRSSDTLVGRDNVHNHSKRVVELASDYTFLMDTVGINSPIQPGEQRRRHQAISDLLYYRWTRASLMSLYNDKRTTQDLTGSHITLSYNSNCSAVSPGEALPRTIKELLNITSSAVPGLPFCTLCPPSAELLNTQFDIALEGNLEGTGSVSFINVETDKSLNRCDGTFHDKINGTTSTSQQTLLSSIAGIKLNCRPFPANDRTFTDCRPIVAPILRNGYVECVDTIARERRSLIQVARSGIGCHILPCTGLQYTTYLPERHHHDWEKVLLGYIYNDSARKVKNENDYDSGINERWLDEDELSFFFEMKRYKASIEMSGPGGGIDYCNQPLYIADKGYFGGGGVYSSGILRREEELGKLHPGDGEYSEQYGCVKTIVKDLKFSYNEDVSMAGGTDRLSDLIHRCCVRVNSLGVFIDRPTSFLTPNQQHHQQQYRDLTDVDVKHRYYYPTMDLNKHRHDPIPMTSVRSIPFSSISEVILGHSPAFLHFCHRIRHNERAQRRLQIASKRQQHKSGSFRYDSYSDATWLSEMDDLSMSQYPLYPGYCSSHFRENKMRDSLYYSKTYTVTHGDERYQKHSDSPNHINSSSNAQPTSRIQINSSPIHLQFPERFEIDDSGELLPRLDTTDGYHSRFYQCATIVWRIPEAILGESYYNVMNGKGEGGGEASVLSPDLLNPQYFEHAESPTLLYEAIPIVFDTKAEWNAFVTSLSNVQYVTKREIPIRFESPIRTEDFNTLALMNNYIHMLSYPTVSQCPLEQALSLMKADEIKLCQVFHISPLYYIAVKRRVLSPYCSPLKSYDDLLDVCDLDYFRLGAIMLFFIEYKEWVRSHTVYRPLRNIRTTQLVGEINREFTD